jgi:hypothetical protein
MLAQGVPLEVVSETLGHTSIRITKDVYGHLLSEANAMEAASWGPDSGQSRRSMSSRPRQNPMSHHMTAEQRFLGGGDGARTHDLLTASQVLFQLSYAPES